jgi:hypothetical protein
VTTGVEVGLVRVAEGPHLLAFNFASASLLVSFSKASFILYYSFFEDAARDGGLPAVGWREQEDDARRPDKREGGVPPTTYR